MDEGGSKSKVRDVIFSQHALLKIEILRRHSMIIKESFIRDAVTNPDKIISGYKGRYIAQKKLDEEHILRVIYERRKEDVLIITFYPARRERYEKS
ncbi:MAG: DUF4258 domain-containing protein [Deltaproteobacteria bacterium]|nr:DUF4258 domain-containing protein [Deltaproteobacteria bacterium]